MQADDAQRSGGSQQGSATVCPCGKRPKPAGGKAARRQVIELICSPTHGTDTMIETARVLIGIPGKRIVLTGAMQPANFSHSDATFNVGMAIGVAITQPDVGVWITMSG